MIRIVVRIRFILAQRNAGFTETLQIRVINKDASGVVGADNQDQCPVVDGLVGVVFSRL